MCNLLWCFLLLHNTNLTAARRISLAFGLMPVFNELHVIFGTELVYKCAHLLCVKYSL